MADIGYRSIKCSLLVLSIGDPQRCEGAPTDRVLLSPGATAAGQFPLSTIVLKMGAFDMIWFSNEV